MKTLSNFSKFVAVIATVAMVLSFASCSLFLSGGALELVSFTVDKSTIKTNYLIGEEIDFSGIKATVKYSDESLNTVYTYDDLDISYADDITATVGDKDVTVSFDDPHLNVKQETIVKIKVTEEPIADTSDPMIVTQFEQPASLTAFNSANASAGASQYGTPSFAGEFAVGGKTYVIGNENAFRFTPVFSALNSDDEVVALSKFYSTVEISVEVDGEYVALTKTAGEGNSVAYHNGDVLIATVDTYNCEYFFSADAEDLKVKISVLPSEDYYIFDGNAVVLEANVIKAYNIYEAWELALIDNDPSSDRGYSLDDANIWDTFKSEKGIAGVEVSGIILHNDLALTSNDVPAGFLLETTTDIVYTNASTGETVTVPTGTKYLRDWAEIYRRVLAPDETFVVEGNFFTIDLSDFPIVPSPAVFGTAGNDADDYGSDFSNATFIKFLNDTEPESEDHYAKVSMNNLSLIGNAARDSLVDSEGSLASAGGLIFLKIKSYANATLNNVIGNSFFITYFPDEGAILVANDIKCYDSYQNAVFVWASSKAYFNNSYLNGSGGPLVICSSPETSTAGVYTQPIFVANNTIIETHLSGEEIWFNAVNANTIVSQIKGLGAGLGQAGLGNFVDKTGKMNIKGLIMAEGDDAMAIVTGIGAAGSFTVDGEGMSRLPDSAVWQSIQTLFAYNPAAAAAPFLTVYDESGNAYTLWSDGTYLYDMTGAMFNPDPTNGGSMDHYNAYLAFQAADTITLTQGGLSVVFDFYHE